MVALGDRKKWAKQSIKKANILTLYQCTAGRSHEKNFGKP